MATETAPRPTLPAPSEAIETEVAPSGSWRVTPGGGVAWRDGQATFPGGWLELEGEHLQRHLDSAGNSPGGALEWDPSLQLYTPSSPPTPLHFTHHLLDRSAPTLQLADLVDEWKATAQTRGAELELPPGGEPSRAVVPHRTPGAGEAGDGSEGGVEDGRGGAEDTGGGEPKGRSEREQYVDLATAFSERLRKDEDELKQDYESTVVAIRRDARVVGLMDYCFRDKTRVVQLKYVLAHPDSQLPPHQRPRGTVGGVWQAAFAHLMVQTREMARQVRSVKMECLSARLYASAARLGFAQMGKHIPPLPAAGSGHPTADGMANNG